jgi:O-antigen ligase
MPDVLAHPLLGRGFGTLNPDIPTQFRINDNEYLDEIWEVGILGLIAYAGMTVAPIVAARRAIRSRDPTTASLALAASAGCVCYLTVSALFDAMSFPQAPYMFFIVAALSTVASSKQDPEPVSEPSPTPVITADRSRVQELVHA